jgi:outer membrane lipoprotein-sorting protein
MQIKKYLYIISILIIISALMSITIQSGYSQVPPQKAKMVLDKFFQKYDALFKDGMKGVNSAVCKMSIKGAGRIGTTKQSGNMQGNPPLILDAKMELYVAQPNRMFFNIIGNLGNVSIVIPDKKPLTATALFPVTKQFASFPVSEKIFGGIKPYNRDKFWQETVLTYGGLQTTKQGKAHKIIMKSTKPSIKETTTVYILDNKWDPVRLEVNDPVGGNTTVDIEQIMLNTTIPPEKFVPNIKGFAQVSQEQLTSLIMMNMMTSNMQKKPLK